MKTLHQMALGVEAPGTWLTPIELTYSHFKSGRKPVYKCRCRCGNISHVPPHDLAFSRTQSCGCLARRQASERFTKYGLSRTAEGIAAYDAFRRCNVPTCKAFKDYGARGIKFEFSSVGEMATWLVKHLPKPHPRFLLDRINNDGHYSKGNLRWLPPNESSWNRRNTKLACVNGRTIPVQKLAKESGISVSCLSYRLDAGIPAELLLHKGRLHKWMDYHNA